MKMDRSNVVYIQGNITESKKKIRIHSPTQMNVEDVLLGCPSSVFWKFE
jgi:hypothetical protein